MPPAPPDGRPRISAVIACYRDAEAVPIMHRRLTDVFQQIGVDHEIIFVNDASPDDAAQVLADLSARDSRVVVINHSRNFGSQSAFTSGMRIATGDAVVLLDGDLQDPPELIETFVERWRQGYDVVYGSRVQRDTTRFLKIAYKAFYRVFRAASYVPMPLDAGDFSLIDRRAVDALNRLPETDRFMRGLRAWVGFRQIGVPYVRPERTFGRTTNSLVKNLGWARKGILSFSYVPLELITMIAAAVVAVSVVGIIFEVVSKVLHPSIAPSGFATVLVVILFLGGIQLTCLACIGSYLAQIYEEVKHRPPFIVESILNPPTRRVADPPDSGADPPTASLPEPHVD